MSINPIPKNSLEIKPQFAVSYYRSTSMTKFFDSCFMICFALALFYHADIKAQVPVEPNGKFASVKGLKIYYEETGSGMPLILMSGFGRIASDWRPFTPELSKYFRVIALDLPGHGRSDYMDTTEVYLHKKAAEYIIGLLDLLHIDSVNVLGASSGGFIALYMATLQPALVKRLIVVGGQVYYSTTTRKVMTSLGEPGKNPILKLENLIKLHGQQKGTQLAWQFWNFRKQYGDPSFTADVLSTITAKALIIHGDNDPIASVSNAWEMYQNIPNAHLWVVPNGGHVPFAVPGNQDYFVQKVVGFLQDGGDRK